MINMDSRELDILIEQYLTAASEAAQADLLQTILDVGHRDTLEQAMLGQLREGAFTGDENLDLRERIFEKIRALQSEQPSAPVYQIRFHRSRWWAAVAILILLAAAGYFWMTHKPSGSPEIAAPAAQSNDIAPGGNKAILYLANGSRIVLDSVQKGQLAKLGNTNVIKTDSGKLLYAAVTDKTDLTESGLNTLSTPRGGIFQLTLPDGTQAWLNAESSITYPTRFTGKQRKVRITGEVYFEVAKDASHPFIVSLPAVTRNQEENGHWMQVEVLGTHFNINAYNDAEDKQVRTTLLEGTVRVSAHGTYRIIKPREQAATAFTDKAIAVSNKVDLEKVMAWKNGEMVLTHGDVAKLMRDISRWYDVDIEYQGKVPEGQFSGSINRNVSLSSVLNVLKAYGVPTRLEGKKLIVF